jgi:hypothetical protein
VNNIKIDLRGIELGGMDVIDLTQEPVEGFCENGNET